MTLSSDLVTLWNESISIKNKIVFAWKDEREQEFRSGHQIFENELRDLERRADRILFREVGPDATKARESRLIRIPYILRPATTFDVALASMRAILNEILAEIDEKIGIKEIPEEWERIGILTDTGNDFYFTQEDYAELEETLDRVQADWREGSILYKEIRRDEFLQITITASLETDKGHEKFAAEMTAKTKVKGMGRDEITEVENELLKLLDIGREQGFEQIESDVMKVGVEYRLGGFASEYPKVDIASEKVGVRPRKYPERTENLRRFFK
ncbi:MAG: hypothetical protein AABY15_08265 [Nanoarchaeota archaeon]